MDTRPVERATEPSSATLDQQSSTGPAARWSPSLVYQLQIAMLERQVTALQRALEREERQRQAVIDRYERLLRSR